MSNLTIQNLSHAYGQREVLHDVSFHVAPGELACVVGPSGCGKSTLLRLIAGLERIQQGDILIDGVSLTGVPVRQRHTGLVFQHPSLFPHLTVRENIIFGLHKQAREEQRHISNRLLAMIGLEERANAYPHQLSGGQHQRVALARALAPRPRVMLLDEPFANLDHALRCEIREDVVGLLKEAGIPIIMVTHDPEEALMMADRMVLLYADGRMHQLGEPDSIHNAPVDVDAAAFFGPVNRLPGRVEGEVIHSRLGDLYKADYAPQLADGSEVLVVTRPEGLRMAREGEPCVTVKILSVRHTGAGWLVKAALPEGDIVRFHHIYGHRPMVEEACCITYEPPHVFVFEAGS